MTPPVQSSNVPSGHYRMLMDNQLLRCPSLRHQISDMLYNCLFIPPFSLRKAGAPVAAAPMMPMARPSFPTAGVTPGAPMSPGMAQSPRKPPPPRNALDDLNIKDFM
ncbi:hypothetical protein CHARACLAT_017648 [Characodon lateralis]|uniref:Uncharacterized protein n=1 Tax=Characodon lateralis TaxID=208331 RepID=A0ABU7EVG8_9TELE|nr:hypothetical protein [Characodon lateralis]